MQASVSSQKSSLRKLMKSVLSAISADEKERQSRAVVNYLLSGGSKHFAQATNVALYLAMKHEEVDTTPLVECLLRQNDSLDEKQRKRIYVPHIEWKPAAATAQDPSAPKSDMRFYELQSYHQYLTCMNDNNKYKIRQFSEEALDQLQHCDESQLDLVIVPGLTFDEDVTRSGDQKPISRLGRGKGYYDRFLSRIPQCHTIAIGFNQQWMPFNTEITNTFKHLPADSLLDAYLDEFVCERIVTEKQIYSS